MLILLEECWPFIPRWERHFAPQVSVTLTRWSHFFFFLKHFPKLWQEHCLGFVRIVQTLYLKWDMLRKLTHSLQDFLLAGLSSYELGCLALEQGVLMERAGFAIWVSTFFCTYDAMPLREWVQSFHHSSLLRSNVLPTRTWVISKHLTVH